MLDRLFNRKKKVAGGTKDYRGLVSRIGVVLERVLNELGAACVLAPQSAIILRQDYAIGWYGDSVPYVLQPGELAVAYLQDCKAFGDVRDALELARQTGGEEGTFLTKHAVEIISGQLGALLKERAKADDIQL
jgi:hypothetical protein